MVNSFGSITTDYLFDGPYFLSKGVIFIVKSIHPNKSSENTFRNSMRYFAAIQMFTYQRNISILVKTYGLSPPSSITSNKRLLD